MTQTFEEPNFRSFMWAGYECAYPLIKDRQRIDLLAATKHDIYCHDDYNLIKDLGIYTVREGLSWHQIDKANNVYDFTRFEKIMKIGKEDEIQQIWDLNHFDFPEYLDPFSQLFVDQFAEYARQCIRILRKYIKTTIYIVPINEISFFSWIGADLGIWAPYTIGKGIDFKIQLVKASIAAMKAIWEEDKDVRFIQVDPIMIRKARKGSTMEARKFAGIFNNNIRYQAWDMLCGKLNPELGGEMKYLDLIGLNHYYHNQQWVRTMKKDNNQLSFWDMEWQSSHRITIEKLLKPIYQRYKRPLIMTETGSYGELRERWWKRILPQVTTAVKRKIPLYGVCAYPIVDRPDWDDNHLTNSGLWDFEGNDPSCRRIPHTKTIDVIKKYSRKSTNGSN